MLGCSNAVKVSAFLPVLSQGVDHPHGIVGIIQLGNFDFSHYITPEMRYNLIIANKKCFSSEKEVSKSYIYVSVIINAFSGIERIIKLSY